MVPLRLIFDSLPSKFYRSLVVLLAARKIGVLFKTYTKKRNRLTQKRLNDLVYVKYNLLLHEKKVKGQASYATLDLHDIDPYLANWIAPPDGEGVDEDVGEPLLKDEQLAEFEMEADDWDADVVEREEEHELGHPSEAFVEREGPIRAPVEDVATTTTSTPPT